MQIRENESVKYRILVAAGWVEKPGSQPPPDTAITGDVTDGSQGQGDGQGDGSQGQQDGGQDGQQEGQGATDSPPATEPAPATETKKGKK